MGRDRYTYLSVYEGHIKASIDFSQKKEALSFWKQQASGISAGDSFRYILRDNRTQKNLFDTWYPKEVAA